MQLKRPGSQPSAKGPEEYFTGNVRIDMLNIAPAPSRVSCASVTFEPGARSAMPYFFNSPAWNPNSVHGTRFRWELRTMSNTRSKVTVT